MRLFHVDLKLQTSHENTFSSSILTLASSTVTFVATLKPEEFLLFRQVDDEGLSLTSLKHKALAMLIRNLRLSLLS